MIRNAIDSDIPAMVTMLRRCYKEMDFAATGYSFNPESCGMTLMSAMGGKGFVLVAGDKHLDGIFAAFKVPSIMDYSDFKMIEFVFHTDPLLSPFKRTKLSKQLLDSAEKETRRQGVNTLHVSASTKEGRNATAFLEKSGFNAKEISFVKGVL